MSIMDNKGRLFGKISLIDILIVLLIVGAAAGVYWKLHSGAGKTAAATKIQYAIEMNEVSKDFVDAITPGDPIREAIKGNDLGHVVSKKAAPARRLNTDYINGKYVLSTVPDLYDVTITIEANANISPKDIIVGGTDIRVGKKMYAKGKGYANACFIMSVDMDGK